MWVLRAWICVKVCVCVFHFFLCPMTSQLAIRRGDHHCNLLFSSLILRSRAILIETRPSVLPQLHYCIFYQTSLRYLDTFYQRWSLGCVLFYLLAGGPPEWVEWTTTISLFVQFCKSGNSNDHDHVPINFVKHDPLPSNNTATLSNDRLDHHLHPISSWDVLLEPCSDFISHPYIRPF